MLTELVRAHPPCVCLRGPDNNPSAETREKSLRNTSRGLSCRQSFGTFSLYYIELVVDLRWPDRIGRQGMETVRWKQPAETWLPCGTLTRWHLL